MTVAGPNRTGGIVFVLSGPSGVGKDALRAQLRPLEPDLSYCITATTRPPRPGEQHGREYFFLTEAEFEQLRTSGGLLEWARVHGRLYGVPCAQVRAALQRGQDVLAEVDVQGAMSIRARIPAAVLIFLAPATLDELRRRLKGRGTESAQELEARLQTAQAELEHIPEFDYLVVNAHGQLERAVQEVRAIITAERRRVQPRRASTVVDCGG